MRDSLVVPGDRDSLAEPGERLDYHNEFTRCPKGAEASEPQRCHLTSSSTVSSAGRLAPGTGCIVVRCIRNNIWRCCMCRCRCTGRAWRSRDEVATSAQQLNCFFEKYYTVSP